MFGVRSFVEENVPHALHVSHATVAYSPSTASPISPYIVVFSPDLSVAFNAAYLRCVRIDTVASPCGFPYLSRSLSL